MTPLRRGFLLPKITTYKLLQILRGCDRIHLSSCITTTEQEAILNIELLKQMDDQHAINALRAGFDPLLNTPLEAYLIDWIEQLADASAEFAPVEKAMDEHDLETKDIERLADALIESAETTAEILSLLHEHPLENKADVQQCLALDKVLVDAGIDTPESLQAELALAQQFRALASDAGDVFSRLTSLIAQEQ